MHSELLFRRLSLVETLSSNDERLIMELPIWQKSVMRRRDIVHEGVTPTCAMALLSGWAIGYGIRPSGVRRIVSVLLPGDLVCSNAEAGMAFDYGVQALTDCVVGEVAISDLVELSGKSDSLRIALRRLDMEEASRMRRRIIGCDTGYAAVVQLLCELYSRCDNAGLVHDGVCEIPLSQEQLGEVVNMSGVHINRIFARLKPFNAVASSKGVIRLQHSEALFEAGSKTLAKRRSLRM